MGVLLAEQKATEALRVADWGYILVSWQVQVSEPAGTILSRPDLGEMFLGGSTSLAGHSDEPAAAEPAHHSGRQHDEGLAELSHQQARPQGAPGSDGNPVP